MLDNYFELNFTGLYGSTLANLAAIVDMELKKREANTSATKWVSRALITCKFLCRYVFKMSLQQIATNK